MKGGTLLTKDGKHMENQVIIGTLKCVITLNTPRSEIGFQLV